MTSRIALIVMMTGAVLADVDGQQVRPAPQPTFLARADLVQVDAVVARVGGTGGQTCTPVVSIARPEGVAVRSFDVTLKAGVIDTTVALTDLLPGSYVLRVGCDAIVDALTRETGFVVK